MRWSWRVVVAACALGGCMPENESPDSLTLPGANAPAPTGRLEVEPGAVTFPRAVVGQVAVATLRVHNGGDTLSRVALTIPSPFTVSVAEMNLPPDAEHTVELRLQPTTPGLTGAVLTVKADARTMELPVMAQVAPAPTGP
ncbi:hypothetical protein [Hyalangium rubrum]|uniref:Abnormal spindle-like microcephaly-associated protein ASH domain-containing protein n=1 Tax=Hyalangium rubrum TaxID=3103134 RepID=A0ABU5HAX0_9BACT|nr:hypothetical protein [Hyalangium sp. s54d21]MDY7229270.1 hypothetical protein [Hyalangium sp. s54d21]